MPKPLIKQPKKRKTRSPKNSKSKDHKGNAIAGAEDRLPAFIKRTLDLKRKGWPLHEIAETIAEEFNLERVPHITTVARWRQQGMEAVSEDLRELAMQLRIDQFNELERMKAKWLPLATADELAIKRWVRIEGELQPELDENAVKEQIEATKQVVAIMARQAKLLGLDLTAAPPTDGDGPGSLQDLQVWMIGQLNINAGQPTKGTIDVTHEVLELKSGIPEVDAV